jgi:hypothetical protein
VTINGAKPVSKSEKRAQLPEGWQEWPGVAQIRSHTGATYTQIKRAARDGVIDTVPGHLTIDGKPRYNPAQIPALEEYLEELGEERDEGKRGGNLTHEEFGSGIDLVRQVHKHHELMVPLLVEGWKTLGAASETRIAKLAEENKELRERISELEQARDAQAVLRERMLSEEHQRLLTEKAFESSERRKDKAFSTITDKLAPVLMQKLGVASDPKIEKGLQFLRTIKREQVLGLLAIGVLDPEQTELARALIEPLTPEEKQALGETPSKEEGSTA